MTEHEMEELIARYPKEFFPRKDLVLKGRQRSFSGVGRFDLLFQDEHGTNVLVELKAVPAKYDHADQLGKYRDALMQRGERYVLMWLVAPHIPGSVREFMDRIGIQYTEIHEAEYQDVARRNNVILEGQTGDSTTATLQPATTQRVKGVTRNVVKDLPSEGASAPHGSHPTRVEAGAQVARTGDRTDDGSVLPDTAPLTLVKSWLQQTKMKDSVPLLHFIHGDYYCWEGTDYRKMEQAEVRGEWYRFFTDRQVKIKTGDGVKITTLHPDRKFCADLHDAAAAYCNVRVEDGIHEPFLIQARAPMDLARAVVFQNGIFYMTDGRLAPLTPDVFITSTLPYEYNPRYQCPKWEWFVDDIFNKDQACIDLLQEWFGYNLIASNHMQSMMLFFGVSGSGKSTTAGVLQGLLGNARCCGASTENLKNLFGKGTLLSKYAAIVSESRDTNRSDIDKLLQTWKAITGGDVINVASKYRQAVDARLFCRLTYVANEAVPFDDLSQAMANRMNLLHFPNNYRKKGPDRMLEYTLKQELPGIALWAIRGLKRLLANDKFTLPAESQNHLAQLAELTNPVGAMLEECTRIHVGSEFMHYRTECSVLYDLWKAWCDATRTKTSLSAIGFGMKLAHLEKPLTRRRIEEAGKRMYVYQGLEITPEAIEKYLKG
jgi:P4 family phage/plasmid primase-like protien